ncbi:MAG: flavin monoamine oxidase family protein [Planctomycetota bacterium]
MAHSPLFGSMGRALRIAAWSDAHGLSRTQMRELVRREADARESLRLKRREFLAAASAALAASPLLAAAAPPGRAPRIAIVGGGLAGLACADQLRRRGLVAEIYEATARVGGRCHSLRITLGVQVAELGGEFIDTTHQTMRQYAVEFGLADELADSGLGGTIYEFDGMRVDEEDIVDEYRILVPRIRADIQTLSGEPSFAAHTEADIALDELPLADWLATRAADLPLVRAALDEAYVAEYGLESQEQSCLNLLMFLHADRRRRFTPFGVFSDERFHLVGGNDAIATRIAARLPGAIETNRSLVRLSRTTQQAFLLEFASGPSVVADFVVLTVPFSVLRSIDLAPNLALGVDKRRAIAELGYGTNAKTMLGFHGRPWLAAGCNGSVYSDRPSVQATWETNQSLAGPLSGILTDYASGLRGAELGGASVAARAAEFLSDLDGIVPGASAAVRRNPDGSPQAARAHWASIPTALGSYTCYRPGQFTGIGGLEGVPVGRLKFAGEHADSFYSWQGFMEGACLSGIAAAQSIVRDLRRGE